MYKHINNLHCGVTDIRHANTQINKLTSHKLKKKINNEPSMDFQNFFSDCKAVIWSNVIFAKF